MMRYLSGAFILTMLLVTSVLAHGNKTHLMGTVTEVSDHSMSVTNQDGASLSIVLTPTTVFRTVSGERTDARPVVGSRVVVDVAETHDAVRATEVRFATLDDAGSGSHGHSHPHHDGHAGTAGSSQD